MPALVVLDPVSTFWVLTNKAAQGDLQAGPTFAPRGFSGDPELQAHVHAAREEAGDGLG